MGGTLNSCRITSPLVRLLVGEERWETLRHSQDFIPLNWGGSEQNRTVTCMVLKANDKLLEKIKALFNVQKTMGKIYVFQINTYKKFVTVFRNFNHSYHHFQLLREEFPACNQVVSGSNTEQGMDVSSVKEVRISPEMDFRLEWDEKWVVYNVKRKRSWSKKDEPAQTISKVDIHQKVMLSFRGSFFLAYTGLHND
ncbi:hypothetical protein TNCV_3417211 [Trichonephila clavipes]|nr:hypothetical protein TNCV_3417211 [Trichonephila clavipes]